MIPYELTLYDTPNILPLIQVTKNLLTCISILHRVWQNQQLDGLVNIILPIPKFDNQSHARIAMISRQSYSCNHPIYPYVYIL